MGRLFKSIRRVFRAILYVISFGLISYAEELEMTEGGIRATYDDSRGQQQANINKMRKAHALQSSLKMTLQSDLESLNEQIQKAQKHKSGAEALAKKRLAAVGKDNIKQDSEYQKYSRLFSKANGNLKKLEEDYEFKEKELETCLAELEALERDLTDMHADLQEINKEEAATLRDIAMAKSKRQAYEAKAGIATNSVDEARQRMQDLRKQQLAQAESAGVLAGAAAQDDMKELEEAAAAAVADDELDALLGLSESSEPVTSEVPEEKLPES